MLYRLPVSLGPRSVCFSSAPVRHMDPPLLLPHRPQDRTLETDQLQEVARNRKGGDQELELQTRVSEEPEDPQILGLERGLDDPT